MRKLIILPLAFLALLMLPVLAYTHNPSESHATAIILPTPSATPTLPDCVTEDGAGMALCTWDAQRMGNGIGESVISGDCAPDYVGGQAVSDLCVNLFNRDSITLHNEDGSSNTIPNGADLVAECTEEWNMMDEEQAKAEGFTLEECFKAWM